MTESTKTRGPADRAAGERAVAALLRALGLDPDADPELAETPRRVFDAFDAELCAGYGQDPGALVAESRLAGTGGVVVVRDLAVTTTCPHHLMTATGTVDVAFAPDRHLIGIGAIARVVDVLARRLVLQETLGEDVVDAFAEGLQPRWVACRATLVHGCFAARGERQHGARVETLALRGDVTAAEALAVFAPRGTK